MATFLIHRHSWMNSIAGDFALNLKIMIKIVIGRGSHFVSFRPPSVRIRRVHQLSLEKVWSAVWKHHGCGPAVMLVLGRTTSISLIMGTLKSTGFAILSSECSCSKHLSWGWMQVCNKQVICSNGVVSNATSYVETPCG